MGWTHSLLSAKGKRLTGYSLGLLGLLTLAFFIFSVLDRREAEAVKGAAEKDRRIGVVVTTLELENRDSGLNPSFRAGGDDNFSEKEEGILKAEMKRTRDQINSGGREFRRIVNDYALKQPWVDDALNEYRGASAEFDELKSRKEYLEIEKWISAESGNAAGSDISESRKAELGRLREFYISYEIAKRLGDENSAALTREWIRFRVDKASGNEGNSSRARLGMSGIFLNSDDILPREEIIEEMLGSDGDFYKSVEQHIAREELGTIDETFPEGGERFIEDVVRASVDRDLAHFRLISAFPELMEIFQRNERLQEHNSRIAQEILSMCK